MRLPAIEVSHFEYRDYVQADIRAGNDGEIPTLSGEPRTEWRRHVTVSISPTGRSVRVWVDGKEVK